VPVGQCTRHVSASPPGQAAAMSELMDEPDGLEGEGEEFLPPSNLGACSGTRSGCSSRFLQPRSRPSPRTRSQAEATPAASSSDSPPQPSHCGSPCSRRAPSGAGVAELLRSPPENAVFSRS